MKQQGAFNIAGSRQIDKVRLLSSVSFNSWVESLAPCWTTLVSSITSFLRDQGRPKQRLEHCFVGAGEYVIQWESVCVGKALGSPGERCGRMDWLVTWMIKKKTKNKKTLQFYRNCDGDNVGVDQEVEGRGCSFRPSIQGENQRSFLEGFLSVTNLSRDHCLGK